MKINQLKNDKYKISYGSRTNSIQNSAVGAVYNSTTANMLNSTTANILNSTTASTTANLLSSTTASTTASKFFSTTASTTTSTTANKIFSTKASNFLSTTASTTANALNNTNVKKVISIAAGIMAGFAIGKLGAAKIIGAFPTLKKFNSLKEFAGILCSISLLPSMKTYKTPEFKAIGIEEIKNKASNFFDEVCQNNNINEESKPILEIESNGQIYRKEKGKEKIIKKPEDYKSLPINTLGLYDSELHIIKINADNCMSLSSIENTIVHELHHTKEAIIRNALPQEERNSLVKEVLLENMKNGDNDKIIYSYTSAYDYEMIETPITDYKTRKHMLSFAEKHLFTEDKNLVQKLDEYYQLKYQTKTLNRTIEQTQQLIKLERELSSFLNDFDEMVKNTDVKEKIGPKAKEKALFAYMVATENRYHYFRKQEQNKTDYKLTELDKHTIKHSIAANIEAVEGNYALGKEDKKSNLKFFFTPTASLLDESETYNNYQYSREEFDAKQKEIKSAIKQIQEKEIQTSKDVADLTLLTKKLEINRLKFEQYRANQNYRKNPTKENRIEKNKKNFALFKKKIGMSARDIILCQ